MQLSVFSHMSAATDAVLACCGCCAATAVLLLCCCWLQDTLDKMLRTFGPKGKLKGARNYCEVAVMDVTTCSNTGAPQPPGGCTHVCCCGPANALTSMPSQSTALTALGSFAWVCVP
jgi:hypothetical protein